MVVGLEHLWVFEATTEALKKQLALLYHDVSLCHSPHARRLLEEVQEELAARECHEAISQLLTEEEELTQESSWPTGELASLRSCAPGDTGSLHCTSALLHVQSPLQCSSCNTITEPQQPLLQQGQPTGQLAQGINAVQEGAGQHVICSEQHQSTPSCTQQSHDAQVQVAEQQWPRLTPLQAAQLAFQEEKARIWRARQAVVRRPQVNGRPVVKQVSCPAVEKVSRQSQRYQQWQRSQQSIRSKGAHTASSSGADTQGQCQKHLNADIDSVQQQQQQRQQQQPEDAHAGHKQQAGDPVRLLQQQEQQGEQGHGELLSSVQAGAGQESHPVGLHSQKLSQQKLSQLRQMACSHHHVPMIASTDQVAGLAKVQTAPQQALHARIVTDGSPVDAEGPAAVAGDVADSMVITAQLCDLACCAARHDASGCTEQRHIDPCDCQPVAVDGQLPVDRVICQNQVPTTRPHSPFCSPDDKQLQLEQLEQQKPMSEHQTSSCLEFCSVAARIGQGVASGHGSVLLSQPGQLPAALLEHTQQHEQAQSVDDGRPLEAAALSLPDVTLSAEPPKGLLLSAAAAAAAATVEVLSHLDRPAVSVFESKAEAEAASRPEQPGGVYNRLTGRAGIHKPLQQDCWSDWDVMAGSLQDTADGFGAWAAAQDL